MSHYRDPQPQVVENYPYVFNKFETKHLQILIFKHSFHSQSQWFDRQMKQIRNDCSRDYTRRQINQDRMIFGDFSVISEPIFLKFCKGHFLFKS